MGKKETGSDKIKAFLARTEGGAENDWKRLSKKKNAEGAWVRVFENASLGKKISVTENADGSFDVTPQETAKPDFARAAPPAVVSAPLDDRLARLMSQIAARAYTGHPDQWKPVFHDATVRCVYLVPEGAPPSWAGVYARIFYNDKGSEFRPGLYRAADAEQLLQIDKLHGAWLALVAAEKEKREKSAAEAQKRHAAQEAKRKAAHARTTRQLLSTPPVETDPAKNKAADAIIERVLECADVSDAALARAGKALANRFGFGIGYAEEFSGGEEHEIMLLIAPLEDTGYDQHVGSYVDHLLPEGVDEAMEATFIYGGKKSLMELAEDMMRRGFVLDARLQETADDQQKKPLWNTLKALYDQVRDPRQGQKPDAGAPKP